VNNSIENPDAIPSPPERIGNYQILQEIGSGGMGTVYLGQHVETGQQAAVKILPASMSREPGFVARFGREIAAMQLLKSPNIVELYESGEDNGIYYYAMEYVDGETLTARLKRERRIPWREVVDIGTQVCRALKVAHNTGIVHRDLKPSNLLIDRNGVVKLTDFGIAQVFASSKLTATGGILGTAEYMSPEQATGSRATRQSDIYSLGAVMYVMLTGRPPFTGKTTLDIIQKHRFSQFDSPRRIVPEIPVWLDEIVCKCLSKKPEDRYPDAYVLSLRLQEVPKKVDLRDSGDGYGNFEADSETISETGAHRGPPVGGTFVRDLFRAEADAQQDTSVLGRFFDNTWVLGGLLVFLIVGAYFLMQWNRVTPEEMFARGQKIMEQPESAQWEVARTQYFEPLLEMDEEKWRPLIEPYLPALRSYELKRQLTGPFRKREPLPQSEPEAILLRAMELRRQGRSAEAIQKLGALETLILGNPEWEPHLELVTKFRSELERERNVRRLDYVRSALQRAETLQESGKTAAARAIWRSVQELYDSDPEAASLVQQARQRLLDTGAAPKASSVSEGEKTPSATTAP
jgi:Serine/threonine protein kinase